MCGIIAILSRASNRPLPGLAACTEGVTAATTALRQWLSSPPANRDVANLLKAGTSAQDVVQDLRGLRGLRSLMTDPEALSTPLKELQAATIDLERHLDVEDHQLSHERLEQANAQLIALKDACFTLRQDRLGNISKVRTLARSSSREEHVRVAYDLNIALNALDRLEVRGRDSAGMHLYVRGVSPDLPAEIEAEVTRRGEGPQFNDGALRRLTTSEGSTVFSFVYKVAAEVGELGDNVAAIRRAIAADDILAHLLEQPGVTADILGHTRWASVGAVSQANAHPLDHEVRERQNAPGVVGALNGDVDNYRALIEEASLAMPPEITTDAKIIPVLVSAGVASGADTTTAFRSAVRRFEGSVAIGASVAEEPGTLYLALRGSGQALYVGLAEDAFIVASEPYGIVEETSLTLRLDGETPADPADPSSRGQVVVLDAALAGTSEGLSRLAYNGTELPLTDQDISRIEITTRDIDRGQHRHYLHKEISEAPESVRKTLRGRITGSEGSLCASLGEASFPQSLRERLKKGEIKRIRVIGQGTAAVAGRGVAASIRTALEGAGPAVDALPATEVSGFQLTSDMSPDLYVAISQSGTTTDTNRTVDLLRARGATVLGIVNRRHSDLTERVDGVLYTSDGRDVEMSVASTKAFYSQIAAGFLLADAIAEACDAGTRERRSRRLSALLALPEKMRELLGREEHIASVAAETAPYRRYWALVGNGRNLIAAEEIRIKLSELCYKAIACDATEDKKHIDLSSEPLILICAAGLEGGTAADVGKEIEIFDAHKACPIVIASDAAGEWRGAAATIHVPDVHRELAFVLSTMAGHLYGYHAAQAIDALARPLREARGSLEASADGEPNQDLRARLRTSLEAPYRRFTEDLREGRYDGSLALRSATEVAQLLRYATGRLPLEFFAEDFGVPGTPASILERLTPALTNAIDDLARPIDAIKHQAKTVTVGTSRGDEELFASRIVRSVLEAGVDRESITYDDLRLLHALEPAVDEIRGFTRYAIEDATSGRTIRVLGQSGSASDLASRTAVDAKLRGTKNTVAKERRALVAVGRSDARPIVLVPELHHGACVGIVLLHVSMAHDLDAPTLRAVLTGYHDHYGRIRDAVTETNVELRDEDLVQIGILDLLTQPVLVIADRLIAAQRS